MRPEWARKYVGKGQDNLDDEVSHIYCGTSGSWAEGFEQYAFGNKASCRLLNKRVTYGLDKQLKHRID